MSDMINKTQFILDCSSHFRSTPCGQQYDVDVPNRARLAQPMQAISKSLYTCVVEAVLEYSRIVWDLFPNGEKCLKFIGAAPDIIRDINSFDVNEQNYEKLFQSFIDFAICLKNIKIEKSDNLSDYLCEAVAIALKATVPTKPTRFIIMSSFESSKAGARLEQAISKTIRAHFDDQHVYLARNDLPSIDIVVINTLPIGSVKNLNSIQKTNLGDNAKLTVHTINSGSNVYAKLICLAFDHYHLTSTTVSGIPMKEEQNSGASIDYDVEIVHPKITHDQFFTSCDYDIDAEKVFKKTSLENQDYETLMLKWCTPKANSPEAYTCIGAHRFTAVKLTSRPSSCLINFLHTGKVVSLEISKITKSSKVTRILSHQLQSHNGELFIHVLSPNRSLLDDPPSISEGVGGHVTDYRTQAFADFMKRHRLARTGTSDNFLQQAKATLAKKTIFMPMTFGESVFFNLNDSITNLYNMVAYKNELNAEEVIQLKQTLFNILQSQSEGHAVLLHTNILRSKGLKKEDLFAILWNELQCIVEVNNTSPGHAELLDCLLQIRPKTDGPAVALAQKKTPQSHNKTTSLGSQLQIEYPNVSLLQIFHKQLDANKKRREEFHGRLGDSKHAKLYPDLNEDRH